MYTSFWLLIITCTEMRQWGTEDWKPWQISSMNYVHNGSFQIIIGGKKNFFHSDRRSLRKTSWRWTIVWECYVPSKSLGFTSIDMQRIRQWNKVLLTWFFMCANYGLMPAYGEAVMKFASQYVQRPVFLSCWLFDYTTALLRLSIMDKNSVGMYDKNMAFLHHSKRENVKKM